MRTGSELSDEEVVNRVRTLMEANAAASPAVPEGLNLADEDGDFVERLSVPLKSGLSGEITKRQRAQTRGGVAPSRAQVGRELMAWAASRMPYPDNTKK